MRYRHVLFDLDGTLYDSYFANIDALRELMQRFFPERPFGREEFEPIFGVPGRQGLAMLGLSGDEVAKIYPLWLEGCIKRAGTIKIFADVPPVLSWLQRRQIKMAVITSRQRHSAFAGTVGDCLPPEIRPYIHTAVCSDDVQNPKPSPDSILHYMQQSGASRDEILFVGDTKTDLQCADAAGVDFALALWGGSVREHLSCRHYLRTPFDLINVLTATPPHEQWFEWAREIQAIGQIGLNYCHDVYDEERWKRLRQIAAEMFAAGCQLPVEAVRDSFLFDRGYITPKVDTRAAIFNDKGEIMLVQEKSGLWNLPGGWCDENMSVVDNIVKEVREEAGLACNVAKLVAVLDRNRHNVPRLPYGVVKFLFICTAEPGAFVPNSETIGRAFFARDALPQENLRLDTNTPEQLQLCFAAHEAENWQVVIE